MKKTLILVIIFLAFLTVINKADATVLIIPNEAIRLRIIPNSNSDEDIDIKNKVKSELEKTLVQTVANTANIDEARETIKNNLDKLDQVVSTLLKNENYSLNYKISYALNYFPEKEYKGTIYKEGYYESVLVTLGEGNGDNWWCVLFPPLCLIEVTESDKDEVEYQFFIKEIIDKYL
ncbi:MAG: stage II sporulation protein R [Bacilli bacterium]|nr:stage II sporulation protein R [Bacilli bacterium]